jgi:hypothetical protein
VEESRVLKRWGRGRLLILMTVLFLGLISNYTHLLPSTLPAHASTTPSASVFITGPGPNGSGNVTDLSNNFQQVTFGVNASNSPSINLFEVIIGFNNTILSYVSLDYGGNVLGPDAIPILYCVNGHPQHGVTTPCNPPNGLGVITLELTFLSGLTGIISNGLLFHVTFKVIGTGLGQVHIYFATLTNPAGNVPISMHDGYYTNLACPKGSGTACRPPIVSISVSPPQPPIGADATFNVTVVETNRNAVVEYYAWDFGDGAGVVNQTDLTQPIRHAFIANTFGLGTGCVQAGNCTVTLSVYDNATVFWKTSIVVHISHLFVHLVVGEVDLDHQFYVRPGTLIHINAKITNRSTISERATLTISLEGAKPPLNARNFTLASSGNNATGSLSGIWDTSGYTPRAYAIVVSITNVVSASPVLGAFIKGENDTSYNVVSNYVLLIAPLLSGTLSLSLLQTTALGILVIAATSVAAARFLKKPSYESEPL